MQHKLTTGILEDSVSHFCYGTSIALHSVVGISCVHHTVVDTGIDVDRYIVLGDDNLRSIMSYLPLQVHNVDFDVNVFQLVSAWVDVVKAWCYSLHVFACISYQPYRISGRSPRSPAAQFGRGR